jgi:hypothetical protein
VEGLKGGRRFCLSLLAELGPVTTSSGVKMASRILWCGVATGGRAGMERIEPLWSKGAGCTNQGTPGRPVPEFWGLGAHLHTHSGIGNHAVPKDTIYFSKSYK